MDSVVSHGVQESQRPLDVAKGLWRPLVPVKRPAARFSEWFVAYIESHVVAELILRVVLTLTF